MATDVQIQDAEGLVSVTLAGSVKYGEAIAYNGTNWVQADASDATTNLYAQYIALQPGVAADVIQACQRCTLYDVDAPWTANTMLFLSGTAGALTSTRPATAGDVVQLLGQTVSTSGARIDIKAPRYMEVFLKPTAVNALNASTTTAEQWQAQSTTDEWVGPDVDEALVAGWFTSRFPENVISVDEASIIINSQADTAVDVDVTAVAAYDGASNTGDAGTTATARTTSAATDTAHIQKVMISNLFDADFLKPGRTFSLRVDPDAGDFLLLGLYLRYVIV